MPALTLNGTELIPSLNIAKSFRNRGIGLIGKRSLPPGQGLLIQPCGSIHTCFMRFPIDVLFLDRQNRVVKIIRSLAPWRMAWGGNDAVAVVEVQSGWLPPVKPGQQLFCVGIQ